MIRKYLLSFYLSVGILLLFAPMPIWAQQPKDITELTANELELANGICREALQRQLGNGITAWYKTTYYYLPTSDEELFPEHSALRRLSSPVSAYSATGIGLSYRFSELRTALKKAVTGLEGSDGIRRCRIIRPLILMEPGGGGGSLGMEHDKVTIIPYEVIIY